MSWSRTVGLLKYIFVDLVPFTGLYENRDSKHQGLRFEIGNKKEYHESWLQNKAIFSP
jgi:hypothetical protein